METAEFRNKIGIDQMNQIAVCNSQTSNNQTRNTKNTGSKSTIIQKFKPICVGPYLHECFLVSLVFKIASSMDIKIQIIFLLAMFAKFLWKVKCSENDNCPSGFYALKYICYKWVECQKVLANHFKICKKPSKKSITT